MLPPTTSTAAASSTASLAASNALADIFAARAANVEHKATSDAKIQMVVKDILDCFLENDRPYEILRELGTLRVALYFNYCRGIEIPTKQTKDAVHVDFRQHALTNEELPKVVEILQKEFLPVRIEGQMIRTRYEEPHTPSQITMDVSMHDYLSLSSEFALNPNGLEVKPQSSKILHKHADTAIGNRLCLAERHYFEDQGDENLANTTVDSLLASKGDTVWSKTPWEKVLEGIAKGHDVEYRVVLNGNDSYGYTETPPLRLDTTSHPGFITVQNVCKGPFRMIDLALIVNKLVARLPGIAHVSELRVAGGGWKGREWVAYQTLSIPKHTSDIKLVLSFWIPATSNAAAAAAPLTAEGPSPMPRYKMI